MSITNLLLGFIILLTILFIGRFYLDLKIHLSDLKNDKTSFISLMLSSIAIFFGSALGISDFTTATLFYRSRQYLSDSYLPGTLNTQCVIPVTVMAIAFISVIKVDSYTLSICIMAQMLGSYLGPRVVVKCSNTVIRISILIGLTVSLVFLLAGKFGLISYGGLAFSLEGYPLLFAALSLVLFGALNCIGIGSYTPSLVTLYALGLNPAAAFPIIMGSAACSTPLSSIQFIKYGQYNRKITLIASVFGVIGALIGVSVVHHLDINMLQWLVVVILFYSVLNLFINELKSLTQKGKGSTC